MRVEAAASARFARSAPWVMLPASTTWRNRLRSVRSKRMGWGAPFGFGEGKLRQRVIACQFFSTDIRRVRNENLV
jgi:hypothetical protein